uniref:NADH dehydrogenase subunit 6 n=1 Tax=Stenamma expolitum TaxID=625355 RepID=UPI001FCCF111|nr:NADH dehydrogenase subunit 6 [Stenamma expolitum]UNZ99545.1 NADH dehydrogenase subunit 6 [Stenamma expolitum]
MNKAIIFYYMSFLSLFIILLLFMTTPLHPIYMTLFLIIYTLFISMILSMWTFNYMYSIILFLMMISGMLIIFLYFSSLISNEQDKTQQSTPYVLFLFSMNLMMIICLILSMFIPCYPLLFFLKFFNVENNMEILSLFFINSSLFSNIFNIYNYPYNNITLLCIFYLLITLFIIIKMCNINNPISLRKIK